MSKINSLDELKSMSERLNNEDVLKTGEAKYVVAVGMATCGVAAGAEEVKKTLIKEAETRGIRNVSIISTGCLGLCYAEPLVEIREAGKEPVRYCNVDKRLATEIIRKHVARGIVLENSVLRNITSEEPVFDNDKEDAE